MWQKSKEKFGSIKTWLLVIIVIVLITGGYLGWQYYQKVSKDNQKIVSIDGWKTYTNNDYGFSFQYPDNWVLEKIDGDSLFSLIINSADNMENGTCRINGCDLPNTTTLNLYNNISKLDNKANSLENYLDNQSTLPSPRYTNVKSVNFGDKLGYQADMGPDQFGAGRIFFTQLDDGKILSIWFSEKDKDANMNDTMKILSTFKFIDFFINS